MFKSLYSAFLIFAFAAKFLAAETTAAAETGASSAAQGAMLQQQLAAEEAAGAQLPQSLTGYTDHVLGAAQK